MSFRWVADFGSQDAAFFTSAARQLQGLVMVGMRKKITLTDVKLPGQPPYSYTKDEQLEFMLNLQVPSQKRAVTIATLLQRFCSVEAVDKGVTVDETDRKRLKEQYGRCRKREPATQQLQINPTCCS
jgi:hypothetical protein